MVNFIRLPNFIWSISKFCNLLTICTKVEYLRHLLTKVWLMKHGGNLLFRLANIILFVSTCTPICKYFVTSAFSCAISNFIWAQNALQICNRDIFKFARRSAVCMKYLIHMTVIISDDFLGIKLNNFDKVIVDLLVGRGVKAFVLLDLCSIAMKIRYIIRVRYK